MSRGTLLSFGGLPAAFWAALLVLVLNDHVLKGSGPPPALATSKLSDFAGLIVAPLKPLHLACVANSVDYPELKELRGPFLITWTARRSTTVRRARTWPTTSSSCSFAAV